MLQAVFVAESIFYKLKETQKAVYYQRNNIRMDEFLPDFENSILIRNLVSESPISYNSSVLTLNLEKFLHDIFFDREFSFFTRK